jgi:hypothetical protein
MANRLKKILAVWLMLVLSCTPITAALAADTAPAQDCSMHDGGVVKAAAPAHAGHDMHGQHPHPTGDQLQAEPVCPNCGDAACGTNGCGIDDCCAFHAQASALTAPLSPPYARADAAVAVDVAFSLSRQDPPLPRPPS